MDNCIHWFYLCLAILGVLVLMSAMLLNYNLKLKDKQLQLEKSEVKSLARIKELEKKNGSEQRQINELNEKIKELETTINQNKTKNQ